MGFIGAQPEMGRQRRQRRLQFLRRAARHLQAAGRQRHHAAMRRGDADEPCVTRAFGQHEDRAVQRQPAAAHRAVLVELEAARLPAQGDQVGIETKHPVVAGGLEADVGLVVDQVHELLGVIGHHDPRMADQRGRRFGDVDAVVRPVPAPLLDRPRHPGVLRGQRRIAGQPRQGHRLGLVPVAHAALLLERLDRGDPAGLVEHQRPEQARCGARRHFGIAGTLRTERRDRRQRIAPGIHARGHEERLLRRLSGQHLFGGAQLLRHPGQSGLLERPMQRGHRRCPRGGRIAARCPPLGGRDDRNAGLRPQHPGAQHQAIGPEKLRAGAEPGLQFAKARVRRFVAQADVGRLDPATPDRFVMRLARAGFGSAELASLRDARRIAGGEQAHRIQPGQCLGHQAFARAALGTPQGEGFVEAGDRRFPLPAHRAHGGLQRLAMAIVPLGHDGQRLVGAVAEQQHLGHLQAQPFAVDLVIAPDPVERVGQHRRQRRMQHVQPEIQRHGQQGHRQAGIGTLEALGVESGQHDLVDDRSPVGQMLAGLLDQPPAVDVIATIEGQPGYGHGSAHAGELEPATRGGAAIGRQNGLAPAAELGRCQGQAELPDPVIGRALPALVGTRHQPAPGQRHQAVVDIGLAEIDATPGAQIEPAQHVDQPLSMPRRPGHRQRAQDQGLVGSVARTGRRIRRAARVVPGRRREVEITHRSGDEIDGHGTVGDSAMSGAGGSRTRPNPTV